MSMSIKKQLQALGLDDIKELAEIADSTTGKLYYMAYNSPTMFKTLADGAAWQKRNRFDHRAYFVGLVKEKGSVICPKTGVTYALWRPAEINDNGVEYSAHAISLDQLKGVTNEPFLLDLLPADHVIVTWAIYPDSIKHPDSDASTACDWDNPTDISLA